MCLEPDSLSSALACPLDLGARPTCRGLRAPLYANYQGLPQGELCPREGKRPRLRSQAVAWQCRLSSKRRESGSYCPCLGEEAPQPECSSLCAQKAPARLGFPGALLQSRDVWMCFGALTCAFGLPSTAPA